MDDLWSVIAEFATQLSPERIESAAKRIEGLPGRDSLGSKQAVFGPNLGGERWERFVKAWSDECEIAPKEVAAGLRAVGRMAALLEGGQAVDLVWTGPRTPVVPVRSTEQVMLEIIDRARRDIFLVTFVNYGASTVVDGLNRAIERGVSVTMLLEGSMESTARLAMKVPAANILIWDDAAKPSAPGRMPATVHAKCMVADGQEALVTSANLTDHALELNMELGVHVIGGREPQQLLEHLQHLVFSGALVAYSDE